MTSALPPGAQPIRPVPDVAGIKVGPCWPTRAQAERDELLNDASFIEEVTTVSMERREPSWEIVSGSDRFVFCITNNRYEGDYQLSFVPRSDILSLRFVRSGLLRIRSPIDEGINASDHTATLHKMIAGHEYNLSIGKDQDVQSVTLHFPAQFIWDEIGLDPLDVSSQLRHHFSSRGALGVTYFMSTTMNDIVTSMINCELRGGLRRHYLLIKARELLYLFIYRSASNPDRGQFIDPILIKHQSKILAAKDMILKNPASPMSIDLISKRVGLNRTTLQKGFKGIFGLSISEYRSEHLMAKARESLDESNQSIAEIADELGYEHHSNFTAAFKRYHGYSPSAYRDLCRLDMSPPEFREGDRGTP